MAGNLIKAAALYTAPVMSVLCVPNTRPDWPMLLLRTSSGRIKLFTARELFAFASRAEAVCGLLSL
jgi:hypothetical protein